MTLDELENTLPWGLHDAYVESVLFDWTRSSLRLDVRVMMSESQDCDQRARITLEGVAYLSVERASSADDGAVCPSGELWIDSSVVVNPTELGLPPSPDGGFVQQFFVHTWNRSFFVCARSAALQWLEQDPQPARSRTRAIFPGSEIKA
jgi:hypothetical protein